LALKLPVWPGHIAQHLLVPHLRSIPLKTLIAAFAVAVSFAAPAALACDGEHNAALQSPKSVTVAEVVKLQQSEKAKAVDANSTDFRAKNGVIPGSIQLTSSTQYDPAAELPQAKDTKLIFYCASEKCGASHQAAERAIGAGYTNVMVMPEGMNGWKKSGQKTAKPNS
jgi:rhodanese-related sulfurtransferase